MLGSLDWNEPEVYEGLKLHIWSWSQCMEEELELLIMPFSLDLYDIMEVAILISLEGDVHLYGKTCSKWSLHVVLNLELGSLWGQEFESSNSLTDVSHSNCYLIVLVWLNIFEKDFWREDLDWLSRVSQVIGRGVI